MNLRIMLINVILVLPTADPLYVSDKYANSSANSLPKLFTLLRECLLSHRWTEVVEVMVAIAKEPANNEVTLLKVPQTYRFCEVF